jgi:predicted HTH domain antitoxin
VEQIEAILDYKEFLNDLTQDELLLFTYVSYPEFKAESAVYDRVIRKRIPIAVSLYKKGKVSLEKAAFLAGLPVEKFLDQV